MFDYSKIPDGYYDLIASRNKGVRSFWHRSKFQYVKNSIEQGSKVLDIGCFAGTFLSGIESELSPYQVGVDIVYNQVVYANKHYKTSFREFVYVSKLTEIESVLTEKFDVITIVEVIEHLNGDEIKELFQKCLALLKPTGKIILTTPNYRSLWPLIEWGVNRFSTVEYEEQHITKFSRKNYHLKLRQLVPQFDRNFSVNRVQTTHFLFPFLSILGFNFCLRLIGCKRGHSNRYGAILHLELNHVNAIS